MSDNSRSIAVCRVHSRVAHTEEPGKKDDRLGGWILGVAELGIRGLGYAESAIEQRLA